MSRYKLVLLSKKNSYPLTNDDIQRNYQTTDDRAGEKLARILSVNQTTVGQWLNGKKKPSYDNILAFYTHFGITPNEFFGIDED